MRALLRTLILILVVLWLGAVMFFPLVAAVAFKVLPDWHTAGLVVRACLEWLHTEGLIAGTLLLLLMVAAERTRAYGRTVIGPLLCTLAMLLLTAFSQWGVMPRMERDRLAVGGDIDRAPASDPHRLDFNQLHASSEGLEEGVLLAGLGMVGLLARAPKMPARSR